MPLFWVMSMFMFIFILITMIDMFFYNTFYKLKLKNSLIYKSNYYYLW
uniref:ATP synthase F0 subunit 8 n=1 Tax=Philodromus sp. TaxID=2975155 RepID=A0A977LKD3_9ARAC|nr:ATP synthase F0 subunit 8 [Philodromus sp.]